MPAQHKELITAGTFNERFQRILLDYYSYGFKNLGSESGKRSDSSVARDWQRLALLIADPSGYMEWTRGSHRAMFASFNSADMKGNPFHRLYRFCNYPSLDYPACFLHTIAALSGNFRLRGGIYALLLGEKEEEHLEDAIREHAGLKTSDLISIFGSSLHDDQSFEDSSGGDVTDLRDNRGGSLLKSHTLIPKTLNNRLDALVRLGVLDSGQRVGEKGKKGNRRWTLRGLTLKRIITCGRKKDPAFEQHLYTALLFYAEYAPFGEIGRILLDRFPEDGRTPFRFRHAYFMQAAEDFNLIDLFCAMERGSWCRIRYRHGTRDVDTELLCFPLEIRVSSGDGRGYLMYYEPFRRAVSAIRIGFIGSVTYYTDEKVKEVLQKTGWQSVPWALDSDIQNARDALGYIWGVSTTGTVGNVIHAPHPRHVGMKIAYNPETEEFIADRVRRERRNGTVQVDEDAHEIRFDADVLDPGEMRPWIRSFYTRIKDIEGMEPEDFTDWDVERMREVLREGKLKEDKEKKEGREGKEKKEDREKKEGNKRKGEEGENKEDTGSTPNTASSHAVWDIPKEVASALKNGKKADAHDLLFSEVFSVYYYIFADVFTELSAGEEGAAYTKKEVLRMIDASVRKYSTRAGAATAESLTGEILRLLVEDGFLEKTEREMSAAAPGGIFRKRQIVTLYTPRYICRDGTSLYKDVIPVSFLERRWLLSITGDPRITMFLSKEEIRTLTSLLREPDLTDMDPGAFLTKEEIQHLSRYLEEHPLEDALRTGEGEEAILSDTKKAALLGRLKKQGPAVRPLPLERIVCYDRLHVPAENISWETPFLTALLQGIRRQRVLRIRYLTKKGQYLEGEFIPIILSYSKRTGRFQAYLKCCEDKRIYTMNLAQFERVRQTEIPFDLEKVEEEFRRWKEEEQESVTVEFSGTHNRADRILTEFSPWKKRCSYDPVTGHYRLTIRYMAGEDLDIVLRLLGYGPGVRIVDPDHPLSLEIASRIGRQAQRNRTREKRAREDESPAEEAPKE